MGIPRKAFAEHEKLAAKLRKVLVDEMKKIPEKKVAILLSSGVDSHCALFAALAAGKTVSCYTFGLDDRNSKDVRVAARTADTLELPWVFVPLTASVEVLQKHVLNAFKIGKGYQINKSSVECLWPMFSTLPVIKEKVILNGMGGDVPYATTRSTKKLAQKSLAAHEAYKKQYIETMEGPIGDIQMLCLNRWLQKNKPGSRIESIFQKRRVLELFTGLHPLESGNKPIQKAPSRLAFWDEFEKCPALIHQSFQKGDTGISEAFEALLDSNWNTKGYRSVVGIYNMVAKGEITR